MKTEKQLQLVTFEQALRLSRLGFDWETEAFYHSDGTADIYVFQNHNAEGQISAPTVALALKWMRTEQNIVCDPFSAMRNFRLEYRWRYRLNYAQVTSNNTFLDYEQAEFALLDELLTILENKI